MEQSIRLRNYQLNYDRQGNPTRPAILFLHGFMGDCREFSQVISLLAEDFYCVSVDLPGHGKTRTIGGEPLDSTYQIEHITTGLIEFFQALSIEQWVLTGYSMGGRLALYLAVHFPQHITHVILESASPGLKTQVERDKRVQKDWQLARQLETEDFLVFLNQWYDQPLFSSLKHHPDFAGLLGQRLQNNPLELAKVLQNLSTGIQPSLWEKLSGYATPSLLLAGELDQKFVDINTEMAELCDWMHLEVVNNCGHNIHLENPVLFAQRLKCFLSCRIN